MNIDSASTGFSAVGSGPRLQVLTLLVRAGGAGLTTGDIQRKLDIPASTLTHHLKHLANGNVISQVKQGRAMFNIANYDHLHALAEFLLIECCIDAVPVLEKNNV
ncbi:MAG: helix-turn-helix transcriptional regulator [Rhodobacteraceae bacterium]|nr:helix-turn-helix transcriptional regulator [Paracoccaceae bacterium]